MNNLKFDKDARKVFDIEHINKSHLFLKGVGRLCKCGCGRHIFKNARKDRVFARPMCRRKFYNENKPEIKYTLLSNISLKLIQEPKPHYNIFVYAMSKGGPRITIPIYQEYKELWNLCESFARYRIKQKEIPMEIQA